MNDERQVIRGYLLELANRILEVDAKIIALRSLLVRDRVISLERFDECLAEINAGANQLTNEDLRSTTEDLDSRLQDLLRKFEGPKQ